MLNSRVLRPKDRLLKELCRLSPEDDDEGLLYRAVAEMRDSDAARIASKLREVHDELEKLIGLDKVPRR